MNAGTQRLANWRARLTEPHAREMLLGSLVALTVKVLAAISLLAMNVVITRTVGASEAGLFFLAFTLVTMLATVGRAGLDQAVVRFVAENDGKTSPSVLRSLYRKAVTIAFAISSGLAISLFNSAGWISENLFTLSGFEPVFKTMLLGCPLVALFMVHAQALQGLKKISKSMLVSSVCLPVFVLGFMLVSPARGGEELSRYFVMSAILTVILGRLFWRQSLPDIKHNAEFPLSTLQRTCMPLWIVAVMHQVIQWSSQLMLGAWENAEAVAYFATAQRTAMLTSFILFAVNAIAAPKFAAMYASGNVEGVKRVALMSVKLMLLVSLPVSSVIFLFPEWLMSFFGEEFRKAAPVLVILAVGQLINIATGSVGYLLSMTGNEKKVRDNVLISGVVSVLLGLLLIPVIGVIGAAIAYSCGVASQNLLGVYQVKKRLGFNTLLFWKG